MKIFIQEVTAPGCSHCEQAKEILEKEIRPAFPEVEVEYGDMMSEYAFFPRDSRQWRIVFYQRIECPPSERENSFSLMKSRMS